MESSITQDPLAAATVAAENTDVPATETETKPGLLESIRANLQTKAALLSERDTYLARATAAEAQVADLTARLDAAESELQTLRSEREEIANTLETVQAEVTTVETAAAQQVASMGFDAAALPAAETEPETKETLLARLAAETDNNKRFALAEKINALD